MTGLFVVFLQSVFVDFSPLLQSFPLLLADILHPNSLHPVVY